MMRWHLPSPGEIRIKRGFLFFPKWIAGECRWLEFASWEESFTLGGSSNCLEWRARAWVVVH